MNPLRAPLVAATLVPLLSLPSAVAGGHSKDKGVLEVGGFAEVHAFGSEETREQAQRHPPNAVCAGAVFQRRTGFRGGGEVSLCGGRAETFMAYAGGRLGWGGLLGPVRLGGGSGLGFGGVNDGSELTGDRRSMFLYARPHFNAGFQLGVVGIEAEWHVMLPVHVLQVVDSDTRPLNIGTPGVGFRLSLLFGKSPKQARLEKEAEEEARRVRDAARRAQQAEALALPPSYTPPPSYAPPPPSSPPPSAPPPMVPSSAAPAAPPPSSQPLALPASFGAEPAEPMVAPDPEVEVESLPLDGG